MSDKEITFYNYMIRELNLSSEYFYTANQSSAEEIMYKISERYKALAKIWTTMTIDKIIDAIVITLCTDTIFEICNDFHTLYIIANKYELLFGTDLRKEITD